MVWNPALHPRWWDGRWRETQLAPGKYELTDRAGRTHTYWLNDLNQLQDCQNMLTYGSRGSYKGDTLDRMASESGVTARMHLHGNTEKELTATCSTLGSVTGVTYHDIPQPPEPVSISRYSQFDSQHDNREQPASEYTARGSSPAFSNEGGAATHSYEVKGFAQNAQSETKYEEKDTATSNGHAYRTPDTLKAELINRKAFEAENAKTYSGDPGAVADAAVKCRKEMQKRYGITESKARNMDVYVGFDKDGRPVVKPTRNPLTGKPLSSPHGKNHIPVATVRMTDLTRQMRALQADGRDNVEFAVSGGAETFNTGRSKANALHWRADFDGKDGQSISAWGTLTKRPDRANKHDRGGNGVNWRESDTAARFIKNGKIDRAAMVENGKRKDARRAKNAIPFHNPKNPAEAAIMVGVREARNDANPKDFKVDSKTGECTWTDNVKGLTTTYSAKAERLHATATNADGFDWAYNRDGYFPGKPAHTWLNPGRTIRLGDGNYRAIVHSSDARGSKYGYFHPDGTPTPAEWRDPKDPDRVLYYSDNGKVASRKRVPGDRF